jgi:hypothetical protein
MNFIIHFRVLLLSLCFALAFASPIARAQVPVLAELAITGIQAAPILEPALLQLNQGQEYLLVINNDNPFAVTFHFEKFGQSIYTQYLQGTPSLSQDRLDIPSNSKILWHFVATAAGEFPCVLSNNSANLSGSAAKITITAIIKTEEKAAAEQPGDQVASLAKSKKDKKKDKKKKRKKEKEKEKEKEKVKEKEKDTQKLNDNKILTNVMNRR